MKKSLKLLFVSGFLSMLMASDSPFIEPEVAVKTIGTSRTQFVLTEKQDRAIIGSKSIHTNNFTTVNILGHLKCSPFYICPDTLEKYLNGLNIENNQDLILYDNSYGIYASTLYMILESVGYTNMKILNGGTSSIKQLDPNQRIYDEYTNELKNISRLFNEQNVSSSERYRDKERALEKKLTVLKSFLLVKEKIDEQNREETSFFKLNESNFNMTYLIGRNDLRRAVKYVQNERKNSNIAIVDACNMVDIVGNQYGNYLPGVHSLDWRDLIDAHEGRLKSNELLEQIIRDAGLKKDDTHYVYCMSGAPKAFYVSLVLRSLGYNNVKTFIGDWTVWRGDIYEK